MEKSLSIIIPVYNTPPFYLNDCLSSIEEFISMYQIEVLLIDDGSTNQDTIRILEKYSNKDNFNHIILKNGGVSNARNIGISFAKNEYIMFVDSDDMIIPDGINSFFINKDEDVDYYRFDFEVINQNGKTLRKYYLGKDTYSGNGVCWAKIFKTSIIKTNSLLFDTQLKYGEDSLFLKQYLDLCSSIKTINKFIYRYRINTANTSHRYNNNVFEDFNKILIHMRNDAYAPLTVVMFLGRYIFPIYLYNKECKLSKKEKKRIIKKYLESDLFEYKYLISKLNDIKPNLYWKIYIYLLKCKQYKLMVIYDRLILKISKKYC